MVAQVMTPAAVIKPALPQHVKDPALKAARTEALVAAREAMQYNHRPVFLPEEPAFASVRFPVAAEVPKEEGFSQGYIIGRALKTAAVLTNGALMRARRAFDPLDRLEDYDDVFIRLAAPEITKTYQEDYAFAAQRTAGVNPMRIAVLPQGDRREEVLHRIKDSEYSAKAKAALAAGQVLVADYTGTDDTYTSPSRVQVRATASSMFFVRSR
jgi:arachidonate 15-lipoxygenase